MQRLTNCWDSAAHNRKNSQEDAINFNGFKRVLVGEGDHVEFHKEKFTFHRATSSCVALYNGGCQFMLVRGCVWFLCSTVYESFRRGQAAVKLQTNLHLDQSAVKIRTDSLPWTDLDRLGHTDQAHPVIAFVIYFWLVWVMHWRPAFLNNMTAGLKFETQMRE